MPVARSAARPLTIKIAFWLFLNTRPPCVIGACCRGLSVRLLVVAQFRPDLTHTGGASATRPLDRYAIRSSARPYIRGNGRRQIAGRRAWFRQRRHQAPGGRGGG